jgi:precorrin-2 dehydrogenase/sirohydrochlorin ferrochelatase
VAINIKGRRALVVGGGKVAERKVKALLGAGARVRVVSPDLTPGLKKSAKTGKIVWVARKIRRPDIHGAAIVIAATSDSKVNASVSRWAMSKKILVNVVDKPRISSFISPAVLKKAGAIIAVYSDGKNPVLSRDLKNFIEENWNAFLSYRDRS